MNHERRRSPRIELIHHLEGQSTSAGVAITVRDISLGGLSLESAVPFVPNDIHEFALTLGDGAIVSLRGRVVYSRKLTTAWAAPPAYVSGIQFIEDAEVNDRIQTLIDRVT